MEVGLNGIDKGLEISKEMKNEGFGSKGFACMVLKKRKKKEKVKEIVEGQEGHFAIVVEKEIETEEEEEEEEKIVACDDEDE